MENYDKEELPSISKGFSEVMHGCNDDTHVEMPLPASSSISKDVSEQSDKYCSTVVVKEEVNDLEDSLITPSYSILKVKQESYPFEFIPEYTKMQGDLDSDKIINFSAEQIVTNVKIEDKHEEEISDQIIIGQCNIKNEEVEIKTEVLEPSETRVLVKRFDNEKSEDYPYISENQCFDKEMQGHNSKKPLTQQIKPDQVFKCAHCDYQTFRKSNLKTHLLRHKNPKEVDMFKCDYCDFETMYKSHLTIHAFRHKNLEDISRFKCDHCDYQSIYKSDMNKHILRHKNPKDLNMFKCNQCNYQSFRKSSLNTHLLRHKNPEDVKMFRCDQCNYQTRYKGHLKTHALRHKNPEDVDVFKCDQCDYQSLDKRNISRHVRRHKNTKDVNATIVIIKSEKI